MKRHAALLASPGMGHLTPFLELAKTLVDQHAFNVTLFVVPLTDNQTYLPVPEQPNPRLSLVLLPFVAVADPSASLAAKIFFMMYSSLPFLRSEIQRMKLKPTILMVDMFGTGAYSIADEFNILKYVFITTNAWFLALTIHAPYLDKRTREDHAYGKNPLSIPGCKTLRFEDTLEPFEDPDSPMYDGYSALGVDLAKSDGLLVNTWRDLESKTLQALLDRVGVAPIYHVGPLVKRAGSRADGCSDLTEWLDKQPDKSVIYVSFGSGGTLSQQQIEELALGLEMSHQRFIWVVRLPTSHHDASGAYFNSRDGYDDCLVKYLPDGFTSRNRHSGLVVPMWAPQVDILAHPSVGGFLSHCGWNSVIESIVNGVPLIAWPLYAEQKMNAAILTEELGIAIRPRCVTSEGIFGREEICATVQKLMVEEEGDRLREKGKEYKHSAERAVGKGGSSFDSIHKFINDSQIKMQILKAKFTAG